MTPEAALKYAQSKEGLCAARDFLSSAQRLETARQLAETMARYKPEVLAAAEAKKQTAWFFKGMRGNAKYKTRVFASRSMEELLTVLDEYQKETDVTE